MLRQLTRENGLNVKGTGRTRIHINRGTTLVCSTFCLNCQVTRLPQQVSAYHDLLSSVKGIRPSGLGEMIGVTSVDVSCRLPTPRPVLVRVRGAQLTLYPWAEGLFIYALPAASSLCCIRYWLAQECTPPSQLSPPQPSLSTLTLLPMLHTALYFQSSDPPEDVHPLQKGPHTTCPARRILHSAVSDLTPSNPFWLCCPPWNPCHRRHVH